MMPRGRGEPGIFPTLDESDDFGVPDTLLGPLPEDFYAGVGRAVALSALLEDRIRALLQQLGDVSQASYHKVGAHDLVKHLRKECSARAADPDWSTFSDFLDRADAVFTYRNDLAHNLWPAQADGSLYGHRVDRASGERTHINTSMADLRGVIGELVSLMDGWRTLFAYAGSEASRRAAQGTR